MVEIHQEHVETPAQAGDDAKYRLIYAKSKVYINPTVYARDNIPGFVAIVKRVRVEFFLFELYNSPRVTGGAHFDISPGMDPRNSFDGEGSRRMG